MNKVIINNKEYEFYLSVRATKEIAKICDGGLFENFDKTISSKNDYDKFDFISEICVILNKAAIQRRNFEQNKPMGDWDEIGELTYDMIQCLDPVFFVNEVYLKALATLGGDSQTTVEVEPEKNVKKPAKKSK